MKDATKRYILTLLLGVFFAIVLYLAYKTMPIPPPYEPPKKIVDLNEGSYEIIFFQVESEKGLVSGRLTDGKWLLEKPRKAPGDPMAILLLLDNFKFMHESRVLENFDDLAEYGLDKPSLTAHLNWKNNEETGEMIVFHGDKTIDGKGVFVKIDGLDQLFLTPIWCVNGANKGFEELRNLQPLLGLAKYYQIIRLRMNHFHSLEIQRDNDGYWTGFEGKRELISNIGLSPSDSLKGSVGPVKRLDKDDMNSLINGLLNLKATRVLSEPGEDTGEFEFGPEDAQLIISYSPSFEGISNFSDEDEGVIKPLPPIFDTCELTLSFGPPKNGQTPLYIDKDHPVFGITPSKIAAFFPMLYELEDRTIIEDLSRINALIISDNNGNQSKLEKEEIISLFSGQKSLKGEENIPYNMAFRALDDPRLKILFKMEEKEDFELIIGPPQEGGEGHYACIKEPIRCFLLNGYLVSEFFEKMDK